MSNFGIKIDEVWAGHPVRFALLTAHGWQFAAYYDGQRRLTVAARQLESDDWTRVQPPGVFVPGQKRDSNVLGWDSHNALALALDRHGCLHLSGNMHNDPLVYYRTRLPLDVTTLKRIDRMTGAREHSCTYPVFFENSGGDLLFRYRDGGSGRGSDLYNIYDPVARSWKRQLETPLLDGQGERNAYAIDPVLGPDGRFHLLWMWRDTPDCATNHTLSYARSRDFVHWENSRGEPLELPITIKSGEVVDPARNGEGLINMTFNLGFDARQQPVAVYHRYDSEGVSQVWSARPSPAGNWTIRQISDWRFRWAFSGFGSMVAEVILGPPRLVAGADALWVDFWAMETGAGRWRLDGEKLEPSAALAPAPGVLPAPLMSAPQAWRFKPRFPDLRAAGGCYAGRPCRQTATSRATPILLLRNCVSVTSTTPKWPPPRGLVPNRSCVTNPVRATPCVPGRTCNGWRGTSSSRFSTISLPGVPASESGTTAGSLATRPAAWRA